MITARNSATCGYLLALLLLCLLGLCLPAHAAKKQTAFITIAGEDEYDLGPYFTYLEDPEGKLTFEDVSKLDATSLFSKSRYDYLNFAVTDSTHWLRIELRHIDKKNRFEPQKEWFVDVRRARLDVSELYVVRSNGTVERMQSDLRIPHAERPIKSVYSVYPLTTERGETVVLYFKIWNSNATYLPIHLRTAQNFIQIESNTELLYGLFFGGMLVLILYNTFLYISIREVSYLYYLAYLVPVTLFEFIDIGHFIPAFEALPWLVHKENTKACIWVSFFAGIFFTAEYLNIRQRNPILYEFFKATGVFIFTALIVSYLIEPHTALLFTAYFCSSGSAVIVAIGVYFWRRYNDTDAALMSAAWAFCVVGYLIYGGLTTGWLPPNGITIASLPMGTLLEATALAFALGERIKQTRNQVIRGRQRSVEHLKRFRSFFDNAAEGIYQLSLEGKLLSANHSMARILGFESSEAMLASNKTAVKLLFSHQHNPFRSLMNARQMRDEISLTDITGATRHTIHSARITQDRYGLPSHIEGTLIDLTERRHNEDAQRSRLKEKHEKELAKVATESKSNFLKDMSYQIRTPLHAIIGFGESLRGASLEREHRQHAVRTVIRNSQTLLQLVNDILDFSKIEAGKLAVEAIDIELMALLRQVQVQFEPLAQEKNLTFRLDCRFPLPARIISDPTRIRQIMQNLCSNAIKYTHRGTVKVIVRWDAIKQQLCLDVEDSGIGMSREAIRRLQNETLDLTGAHLIGGLGIAITRHLTRLLGGELHIESREGFGSRFTAAIGCRIASQDDWVRNAAQPQPAKPSLDSIPRLKGNVLLAEDNAVNQKLIARLISRTGASVVIADNGQRALDLAQESTFDLILMDINMPVMDGLTATRDLKAQGLSTPVYALTAEHGGEAIQECLAAGCEGHLTKPIDVPAFYATLARHLAPAAPEASQENQQ